MRQSFCLVLIIGILAVSGNASAEEAPLLPNAPTAPYPRFGHVEPVENAEFSFSVESLLDVGATGAFHVMVPQGETADLSGDSQTDLAIKIDIDYQSEALQLIPEGGPYPVFESSSQEITPDDEQLDLVLFFSNIEKMMTIEPGEADSDQIVFETDPVLISLEGDWEAQVENESEKLKGVDLTTLETSVSAASDPTPDIPVYTNKRIKAFVNMYAKRKRAIFRQAIERSGIYMKMINRIFIEYELPPNLAYLAVVESNFNPFARSSANAVGMWQFMKYTGKVFDLHNSWWHDDRFDPEKSTRAAAQYLKRLHKRFNGDWELALAAYNSGSGTVRRAIRLAKRNGKKTDYWSLKLPRETRGYVPAFYAVATIFDDLEAFGFKPQPVLQKEILKKQLKVVGGISLKGIAKALAIEHKVLSAMNPSLRPRGLVPPTFDHYQISIPGGLLLSQQHFANLDKLAENRLSNWKTHSVKQGETLWSISRYYKIPVKKILAFNSFRRKNLITIGQTLMLPVATNWVAPVFPSRTKLTKRVLDRLPGVTYVHKVQKGDTLWKISNKYNIPIKVIKYWNRKVLKKRVLRIGTEIVLKLPRDFEASST